MPRPVASARAVLTVPGLFNSGRGHWQTIWDAELPNCRRAELSSWTQPHRNSWVSNFGASIARTKGPIILAAHSLGATLECQQWNEKIVGALLVAPPDVDSASADCRLLGFASSPKALLPFHSVVVVSRNDPCVPYVRAQQLVQQSVSQFARPGRSATSMPIQVLANGISASSSSPASPPVRSRMSAAKRRSSLRTIPAPR